VTATLDMISELLDAELDADARAELEHAASLLALSVSPIAAPPSLRARLLAEIAGRERLAPFVDRVASLFDLATDRIRTIFELFDTPAGWTPLYPGAAFHDLEGGPALGEATAGLVRIAAGLSFPHHKHIGEERVLVLQGAFIDSSGQRVEAGQLVIMPDASEHGFEVVSEQELLYVVVVGEVEFEDGTRAP
jgi:quercetin dioxygenase-like cupin family protein